MAQGNVYSLNVVGYVNTRLAPSFTLICNPLNAADNHLGKIMTGTQVPDNTIAFTWNPAIQDFGVTATYSAATSTWVPDAVVTPGMGLLVYNPGQTPFTNTFVGDVLQGSITNQIYPQFNMIASPVPVSGTLGVVLTNIPATDNDLGFQFSTVLQDFGNPDTYSLRPRPGFRAGLSRSRSLLAKACFIMPMPPRPRTGCGLLRFNNQYKGHIKPLTTQNNQTRNHNTQV